MCVCVSTYMHVCEHTHTYVCVRWGVTCILRFPQKTEECMDSSEPELRVYVSCPMWTLGSELWSSEVSSKHSSQLNHPSSFHLPTLHIRNGSQGACGKETTPTAAITKRFATYSVRPSMTANSSSASWTWGHLTEYLESSSECPFLAVTRPLWSNQRCSSRKYSSPRQADIRVERWNHLKFI